jgi:hypothetical protein
MKKCKSIYEFAIGFASSSRVYRKIYHFLPESINGSIDFLMGIIGKNEEIYQKKKMKFVVKLLGCISYFFEASDFAS